MFVHPVYSVRMPFLTGIAVVPYWLGMLDHSFEIWYLFKRMANYFGLYVFISVLIFCIINACPARKRLSKNKTEKIISPKTTRKHMSLLILCLKGHPWIKSQPFSTWDLERSCCLGAIFSALDYPKALNLYTFLALKLTRKAILNNDKYFN